MALALLMVHLAPMSGAMLLAHLKMETVSLSTPAPVQIATVLHHRMSETTTTVSQLIEVTVLSMMYSSLMIHSGMASSVTMKVPVALAPILHRGSVWISLTAQVMI